MTLSSGVAATASVFVAMSLTVPASAESALGPAPGPDQRTQAVTPPYRVLPSA